MLTGAHVIRGNARQAYRDRVREIKSGVSHLKSGLMRSADQLREIGASGEAAKLERIIYRLEAWQQTAK